MKRGRKEFVSFMLITTKQARGLNGLVLHIKQKQSPFQGLPPFIIKRISFLILNRKNKIKRHSFSDRKTPYCNCRLAHKLVTFLCYRTKLTVANLGLYSASNDGWIMNWKRSGRKWRWPTAATILAFAWRDLMNTTTNLGQETGISAADIRTEHLLNTHRVEKVCWHGFLGSDDVRSETLGSICTAS